MSILFIKVAQSDDIPVILQKIVDINISAIFMLTEVLEMKCLHFNIFTFELELMNVSKFQKCSGDH